MTKEYYEEHKESIRIKHQLYHTKNRERLNRRSKQYREDNLEVLKQRKHEYYIKNCEEIKRKRSEYYKINSERVIKQIIDYEKEKRANDPKYRVLKNLRRRITLAIQSKTIKKSGRTFDLLGSSPKETYGYLESLFKDGMSWDNYGFKGWHIDHIKPCSSFDLSDLEQQKQCFHYSNLQPLWWWENLEKSDKIID